MKKNCCWQRSLSLIKSPVALLELFTFQELLQINPEACLLIDIVVSLVAREGASEDVPSSYLLGYLHILVREEVAPHSGKQLLLVQLTARTLARLPVFELPVGSRYNYSDHTLPPSACEIGNVIINVKRDHLVSNFSFNLQGLVTIRFVFAVDTFLKELLNVSNAETARCQGRRHNYNWMGS